MSKDNAGLKLRELRETLGISLEDVAQFIGISPKSIGRFEKNPDNVKNAEIKDTLTALTQEPTNSNDYPWIDELREEKKRKAKEREEQKAREREELRKKMFHSFTAGKEYLIFDSGNAKDIASNDMKPETGKGCIFIYVRKEGRHHMFREKRGGWIRTYTDTQLMGKKIKEVTL